MSHLESDIAGRLLLARAEIESYQAGRINYRQLVNFFRHRFGKEPADLDLSNVAHVSDPLILTSRLECALFGISRPVHH